MRDLLGSVAKLKLQVLMLEVLHHQIRRFSFAVEIVNPDDVLMLQPLAALELVLQRHNMLFILAFIPLEHFQHVSGGIVRFCRFPYFGGNAHTNETHESIRTEEVARTAHSSILSRVRGSV